MTQPQMDTLAGDLIEIVRTAALANGSWLERGPINDKCDELKADPTPVNTGLAQWFDELRTAGLNVPEWKVT